MLDDKTIEDDQLRLIFICCHPVLPPDAQVAMTLREVCGLTTEEIAAAFLTAAPTIAQRIVRAKAEDPRSRSIPYETPARDAAAAAARIRAARRLPRLQRGLFGLVRAHRCTRPDLCGEAIRLGRLLVALLPDPEAIGLLALMLLQESRRAARADAGGEVVLLEDQDRSRWDRALIGEGLALVERALAARRGRLLRDPGGDRRRARARARARRDRLGADRRRSTTCCCAPTRRRSWSSTAPRRSPMRDGPAAGLALIDAILERGELGDYHPPTPRAPSSAGGSAGRTRPQPPTTRRCRLPGRSRRGISWKSAGANWGLTHECVPGAPSSRGGGGLEPAARGRGGKPRAELRQADARQAADFLDGLYERVALEGTSEPARLDPLADVSSPQRYH